jgi:hypothetical protein
MDCHVALNALLAMTEETKTSTVIASEREAIQLESKE